MSGDAERDELADLFVVDPAWRAIADMDVTRLADAILSSAWFERVKREAAAEAWDEAADAYWRGNTMPRNVKHYHRMRDRATAIRSEATS